MKPQFLNNIIIFYTNDCNAKCRHCFISPLQDQSRQVMSFEVLKKTFEYAKFVNSERIIFK